MPSRWYSAGLKTFTNVLDYGADNTGSSDSLAAFNAAIAATKPGGTCYAPAGTYNFVQDSTTTVGQIIRLKAGVTLRGAGIGQTYFKRNYQGSPLIVAIRAPFCTMDGFTMLNNGYRTGLTFPTAATWRDASSTYDYGTLKMTAWDKYYETLFDSTGLYCVPRDMDCGIFVAGSKNVTIQNVAFDSNYSDELGWWFNCIGGGANEDETKLYGLTVKNCTFAKARFGVTVPSCDSALFDGLIWESDWSYANAPPGHLIYVSGSPANYTSAEFTLCSSITVQNCIDRRVRLTNTYSAAADYYGDVTLKFRKVDGLTIQDCSCVAPQAGINLYDIANGSITDCLFDASSTPDVPTMLWGGTCLFMNDQTRNPATGYTASNYILGPVDLTRVTFISPPPGTYDSTWARWLIWAPYKTSGGTAPASVGDTWQDVSLYLASNPSSVATAADNRMASKDGVFGTVSNPVRFFVHPDETTFGSDQRLFEYNNIGGTNNSFRVEVNAPSGSYVPGHPPGAHSSYTGATLNGSAFTSGSTVTFSDTTTADPN